MLLTNGNIVLGKAGAILQETKKKRKESSITMRHQRVIVGVPREQEEEGLRVKAWPHVCDQMTNWK